MYAAEVESGVVVRVIVGDPVWAAATLGGEWFGSESLVGVGWLWDGMSFVEPQAPDVPFVPEPWMLR